MMVHACNLSTWEVEAEDQDQFVILRILRPTRILLEILSQRKQQQKTAYKKPSVGHSPDYNSRVQHRKVS